MPSSDGRQHVKTYLFQGNKVKDLRFYPLDFNTGLFVFLFWNTILDFRLSFIKSRELFCTKLYVEIVKKQDTVADLINVGVDALLTYKTSSVRGRLCPIRRERWLSKDLVHT